MPRKKKKASKIDDEIMAEDTLLGAFKTEDINTLHEVELSKSESVMRETKHVEEYWANPRPDVEAYVLVKSSCPHCQTWMASNHHEVVMRYLWLKKIPTKVLDLDTDVIPFDMLKYDVINGPYTVHTPAVAIFSDCDVAVVEIDSETLQKSPKLLFYKIQQAIENVVEVPQYVSVLYTAYRVRRAGQPRKPAECFIEPQGLSVASESTVAPTTTQVSQAPASGGVSPCVVQPRC